MENFAQLHFYGQIHKNSSRIRILSENYRAKTTATLPRARYIQPAPEQSTIRFCRI